MKSLLRLLNPAIALIATLAASSLFVGCTTPPEVGGLDANLSQIKSVGSENITATILYVNDSTRPIAIQAAEHEVYFAGQLVGHALMKTPLGLPPLSTVERTVLVTPTNVLGRNLINDAERTPGASWRLSSRIAVNYGGEDIILRSNTNGQLGH
ncbi:hypothetical protein Ga0100230_009475 [Opitutaceae bacterium TAV3]|nr:hypothetical protein Ga0100230_009475 [Opitutaceae bacterium TAV3]